MRQVRFPIYYYKLLRQNHLYSRLTREPPRTSDLELLLVSESVLSELLLSCCVLPAPARAAQPRSRAAVLQYATAPVTLASLPRQPLPPCPHAIHCSDVYYLR